ncbi:hypothetical protein AFULGI_00003150 [Archaeoglobus fulgidus DSM 8774]|uniref:Uncharacterized protein n=1 Tax=Archaeoglobus fulgidus DSM 8774 TaxID=1344584 RepID=A0A075WAX4_ARCFL|nr:hypothetical protein AFULGI_00003150 [Archaeoglobus fulgidus DSM 8774]
MEKIFIDTNVIIDLLRGKKSVVSFFRDVEDGEIHGLTNKNGVSGNCLRLPDPYNG